MEVESLTEERTEVVQVRVVSLLGDQGVLGDLAEKTSGLSGVVGEHVVVVVLVSVVDVGIERGAVGYCLSLGHGLFAEVEEGVCEILKK